MTAMVQALVALLMALPQAPPSASVRRSAPGARVSSLAASCQSRTASSGRMTTR